MQPRPGQGKRLEEVAGQQGLGLGAQETGPVAELRSGTGSIPASCRISQTVEAATFTRAPAARHAPGDTPTGILADQPQCQDADRAHGARPARAPGPGPPGVPARHHIAVPAQHGIRAHHQVQALEHVPREPVQQRRQQRPVSRGEPDPVRAELPLQDRGAGGAARGSPRLCPGCSSAAAAAARTRSSHRDRPVASARSITMPQRSPSHERPANCYRVHVGLARTTAPTSMDEVFGRSRCAAPARRPPPAQRRAHLGQRRSAPFRSGRQAAARRSHRRRCPRRDLPGHSSPWQRRIPPPAATASSGLMSQPRSSCAWRDLGAAGQFTGREHAARAPLADAVPGA